MDLDTERLRTFLAVARTRNFSRAARRLGKTQPSVSQAIARLEREVGQPLFVREGRLTHLAPAGRLLVEHAERIFEEMDRAQARLSGLAELRAGELVVGASDTLAYYLLPPVLAAFRARHPGIELRLDNRPSPAILAALRGAERAVDVAVVTLPLPGADQVRREPLVAARDLLICPPDHALAGRRRVHVRELGAHPLLLLDRTTGARATLDAAFAQAGVRPRVTMEMSSVEVLKRLVELGFGLSVVPALAVEREARARTLVAIPLRGLLVTRSIALVLPGGPPSPAATAFAAIARETLCGGAHAARGGD
jgi:DNA-binding transcriptional LysR family regulator